MEVHSLKCGMNMCERELRRYLYLQSEINKSIFHPLGATFSVQFIMVYSNPDHDEPVIFSVLDGHVTGPTPTSNPHISLCVYIAGCVSESIPYPQNHLDSKSLSRQETTNSV